VKPKSDVAIDLARRLCSIGGINPAGSTEDFAAAAGGLCARLRLGLGHWVGIEGYRALFGRAIWAVQADHPALIGLASLGGDERATMTSAVALHGAAAVAAGLLALVAELTQVLGRIIGEDMAVQLVGQVGVVHPTTRV